jgi:hypothetical protein
MQEEVYRRDRKTLNTRITKHKCNTKMGEISKSRIVEQSWDEDHRTQWNHTQRRKEDN